MSQIEITSYALAESAGTQRVATQFKQFVQTRSVLTHAISAQAAGGGRIARLDIYDGAGAEAGWIAGEQLDVAALDGHQITEKTSVSFEGEGMRRLVLTDAQGGTTEQTLVLTVAAYRKPQLYLYEMHRCDASANLVSNGTRAYQFLTGYMPSIKLNGAERNPFTCSIRWREVGGSTWKTTSNIVTHGDFVRNSILGSGVVLDVDTSYEFELTLSDFFYGVSRTAIVPRAYKLISLHEGGQGIAIGQSAVQNNLLDVSLPARFRSDVALDSPLPIGSGGTGTSSIDGLKNALNLGTQTNMQFGRTSITIPANTTAQLFTITYPVPFAAQPSMIQCTLETTAGIYQATINCTIYSSSATRFQVVCGNSGATQRSPTLNWMAIA